MDKDTHEVNRNGNGNCQDCQNFYCQKAPSKLYPAIFGKQTIYFCGECIIHYNNRQCCYFCAQVYSEQQTSQLDGKEWIQCDECRKWMHLDCERTSGIENIDSKINDDKYKYLCPWCRQCNGVKKNLKTRKYETKRNKLIKKTKPDQSQQQDSESNQKNVRVASISRQRIEQVLEKPIIQQLSILDDLLKKYGGLNQSYSIEDTRNDLALLRSVTNN